MSYIFALLAACFFSSGLLGSEGEASAAASSSGAASSVETLRFPSLSRADEICTLLETRGVLRYFWLHEINEDVLRGAGLLFRAYKAPVDSAAKGEGILGEMLSGSFDFDALLLEWQNQIVLSLKDVELHYFRSELAMMRVLISFYSFSSVKTRIFLQSVAAAPSLRPEIVEALLEHFFTDVPHDEALSNSAEFLSDVETAEALNTLLRLVPKKIPVLLRLVVSKKEEGDSGYGDDFESMRFSINAGYLNFFKLCVHEGMPYITQQEVVNLLYRLDYLRPHWGTDSDDSEAAMMDECLREVISAAQGAGHVTLVGGTLYAALPIDTSGLLSGQSAVTVHSSARSAAAGGGGPSDEPVQKRAKPN